MPGNRMCCNPLRLNNQCVRARKSNKSFLFVYCLLTGAFFPPLGRHAIAGELCFTLCLEGRCLQRLRPTGRKDAEPPIGGNPAKELQAAPLQVPAGCAAAATTERNP